MPTIINYAIVCFIEITVLRDDVAALIGQGWQPFGSLTSSPCQLNALGELPNIGDQNLVSRIMFAQALVQYAND